MICCYVLCLLIRMECTIIQLISNIVFASDNIIPFGPQQNVQVINQPQNILSMTFQDQFDIIDYMVGGMIKTLDSKTDIKTNQDIRATY